MSGNKELEELESKFKELSSESLSEVIDAIAEDKGFDREEVEEELSRMAAEKIASIKMPDAISDAKSGPVVWTRQMRKAFGYKIKPYTRESKKIRRNDICPCGSGFKYKNCCVNGDLNDKEQIKRITKQAA